MSTNNPFISQNVWLKRLGLVLLLIGMGFIHMSFLTIVLIIIVIVFATLSHIIKLLKSFLKSFFGD
jgi:uncharacterized membrane protein